MSTALKARLRDVKAVKSCFRAASNREQDISDFQSVVYELEELFKSGFLEEFVTHTERHTGHDWVDFVCVGGLTAKGETLLED